ncbi:MAG: XRE family transcriptional regulator [Acidobacteria bacterium]|nr:XRE family transcriptional regulator [Acidobacteriota bacterium]
MGTMIGQMESSNPLGTGSAGVQSGVGSSAAREVVRCGDCSLVQFRTASDMCRRCTKPLPSLLRAPEAEPEAALHVATDPFGDLDDGQPVARAERNRRVAMGSRLRACRIKMGLTQIEMAARLNIPRTYLSRIENDRLLPGPLMIAKFAFDLGLNVSDMLPSFAAQIDGDRRWDGISRRILNVFEEMQPTDQAVVLQAARSMLASVDNSTGRAATAIGPGSMREMSTPPARTGSPVLCAAR